MRRALTIAAIAIVVFGLGVGIYFAFFAGGGSGLTVDPGTSGNPFGTPGDDTLQGVGGTDTIDTSDGKSTQVAPHLVKITSGPVARGFIVLDPSTTTPAQAASSSAPVLARGVSVRYIDRESGNMYAYNLSESTSVRLTNHTAPGVQEVSWTANGSTAFIRFLTKDTDRTERIDTYALPADGSEGRVLTRDLSQVITQGTATLITLAPSTGGSIATISKPDGSTPATLFSSALSAIKLSSLGTNLLAYTKPSNQINGYAFSVDRKSGAFSKIAGPAPGLTAIGSPSGKQILMSYIANGALTFALYDIATHTTTTLPVTTFTEKCVWSHDSTTAYCAVPTSLSSTNLPDSWYQGVTAFSDRIWKIDMSARVATLVVDLPKLSKEPVDAVSLSTNPNGSALVFMNKRDGSLWSYTF